MKILSAAIVVFLAAASAAKAQDIDLGKLIAQDLAKRRGMVALEDAGTAGAVIGAKYSNPTCRREFERLVRVGRPMAFGLVAGAPRLNLAEVTISQEATYKLDRDFISRNKAAISLLEKIWNMKAGGAADFIRRSNITFKVYRKRYPALMLPRAPAMSRGDETILGNLNPPAGTVSVPYEVLFVTDFTFREVASNSASIGAAAAATQKAKVEINASVQRDGTGNIILPDHSAVAFKPLIVWDAARCRGR